MTGWILVPAPSAGTPKTEKQEASPANALFGDQRAPEV